MLPAEAVASEAVEVLMKTHCLTQLPWSCSTFRVLARMSRYFGIARTGQQSQEGQAIALDTIELVGYEEWTCLEENPCHRWEQQHQ